MFHQCIIIDHLRISLEIFTQVHEHGNKLTTTKHPSGILSNNMMWTCVASNCLIVRRHNTIHIIANLIGRYIFHAFLILFSALIGRLCHQASCYKQNHKQHKKKIYEWLN